MGMPAGVFVFGINGIGQGLNHFPEQSLGRSKLCLGYRSLFVNFLLHMVLQCF